MNILVTGGLGYIGSHILCAYKGDTNKFIILDNLSNSEISTLGKIEKITGKNFKFFQNDLSNKSYIKKLLFKENINAVIHLAGFKSVEESFKNPIKYYNNNLIGTLNLIEAMDETSVRNLIFSSSATVYGHPQYLPINEKHPINPINPYGRNKANVESLLNDICFSNSDWGVCCLRYFNPIGAHTSGLIGECNYLNATNLFPMINKVITGKEKFLKIFGSDLKTKDGSGVRDYIHVMDIANAHISALDVMKNKKGISIYNLGSGSGFSVLEIVKATEKHLKKSIPFRFFPSRKGDVVSIYCSRENALHDLKWKPVHDLNSMIKSNLKFIKLFHS